MLVSRKTLAVVEGIAIEGVVSGEDEAVQLGAGEEALAAVGGVRSVAF